MQGMSFHHSHGAKPPTSTLTREAVLRGESSGNLIEDYLVVAYGRVSPFAVANLTKIARRVKAKVGSLVLAVSAESLNGKTEIVEQLYLTKTTSDSLIIEPRSRTCALPSEKYVTWEKQRGSRPILTRQPLYFFNRSQLKIDQLEQPILNQMGRNWTRPDSGEPYKGCELLFGEKEIAAWLKNKDSFYTKTFELFRTTGSF